MMRIASISKPITAALVGRLIEQGKLSLDDSVYVSFRLILDNSFKYTVQHQY